MEEPADEVVGEVSQDLPSLPRIHWLASYPKSGNTWVRALLYAYQYGTISLDQMRGHVLGDQLPGAWFAASPVPWGLLNGDQRLLLRYSALMNLISYSFHGTTIAKTHCANICVNSIELIPNELSGSSVYLVRDPRDVVVSYAHHMGIDIDTAIFRMNKLGLSLGHDGNGIIQPTGDWSASVLSWSKHGHFPREVIRYEDLKTQPVIELARILKCIYDVDPDEERMRRAIDLCEFNKLKKQEEEEGFKEATKNGNFFRKGKSTWREVLTDDQIRLIEEAHAEQMQKLGYELTLVEAA